MALGKVLGVYRLSRDIELRYLPSGQALAKNNITIAKGNSKRCIVKQ